MFYRGFDPHLASSRKRHRPVETSSPEFLVGFSARNVSLLESGVQMMDGMKMAGMIRYFYDYKGFGCSECVSFLKQLASFRKRLRF